MMIYRTHKDFWDALAKSAQLSKEILYSPGRCNGKSYVTQCILKKISENKEDTKMSFYMKDHPELLYFKTIEERGKLIDDILLISRVQGYLTIRQLADLCGVKLEPSWDCCGWTKEALVDGMRMECLGNETDWLYPYRIVLPDEEMLNLKKEPKKRHDYSINGTCYVAKYTNGVFHEDNLKYSVRVDTTDPKVYHDIFNFASSAIEYAQKEEEKES